MTLQADLNRLAGTTGLDAQLAANRWAGTTGLDLVGALNVKNGSVGLELNGVVKALAAVHGGNPNLDNDKALSLASGGAPAFSPTDIAGLALWLDASQLTGLSDGDPVGSWTDLSGNARHATQGTGAAKPMYKTAILNGKPGVLLDGVDDYIETPSNFLTAASQTLTAFLVIQIRGTGSTGGRDLAGAVGNWLMGARESNGGWVVYNDAFTAPVGVVGTDEAAILSVVQDSPGLLTTLRKNGSVLGTTSGAPRGPSGFSLGEQSGEYSDSYIFEVIAYDTILSTNDRNSVTAYLGAKYGIAVV